MAGDNDEKYSTRRRKNVDIRRSMTIRAASAVEQNDDGKLESGAKVLPSEDDRRRNCWKFCGTSGPDGAAGRREREKRGGKSQPKDRRNLELSNDN